MVKEFEELPLDTNYLFDENMYRYSTLLPQLKLIEQAKKMLGMLLLSGVLIMQK